MGISDSATYAELTALPAHLFGEIVGGTLFATPRPSGRHVLAASALGSLVGLHQKLAHGGLRRWWVLDGPELHLGQDVLVADVAGWRRERMSEVPDEPFFGLAPDWICEVVSPSTAKLDLAFKLPRYAGSGVPYAWIVTPSLDLLEVFDLRTGGAVLIGAFAGSDRVRAPPFLEVDLELGLLWGRSSNPPGERPQSPAR